MARKLTNFEKLVGTEGNYSRKKSKTRRIILPSSEQFFQAGSGLERELASAGGYDKNLMRDLVKIGEGEDSYRLDFSEEYKNPLKFIPEYNSRVDKLTKKIDRETKHMIRGNKNIVSKLFSDTYDWAQEKRGKIITVSSLVEDELRELAAYFLALKKASDGLKENEDEFMGYFLYLSDKLKQLSLQRDYLRGQVEETDDSKSLLVGLKDDDFLDRMDKYVSRTKREFEVMDKTHQYDLNERMLHNLATQLPAIREMIIFSKSYRHSIDLVAANAFSMFSFLRMDFRNKIQSYRISQFADKLLKRELNSHLNKLIRYSNNLDTSFKGVLNVTKYAGSGDVLGVGSEEKVSLLRKISKSLLLKNYENSNKIHRAVEDYLETFGVSQKSRSF